MNPEQLIPQLVIYMVVLLLAISAHEAAHAWMSYKFGDDTARLLGRITLNPVAHTDPIGTLPRLTLERVPATERFLRRVVGADDSLPVYKRDARTAGDIVAMGSGGALVSIDKLRRVLGFEPPVPFARALDLTLEWARQSRVISGK